MIHGRQALGMPSARRAEVAGGLLVVYLVWGSTYLGLLLAIRTIPVFVMASVRFLIAGGLLYAWAIRRGDRSDRPGLRQWLAASVLGGLLFLVGNTSVAWAEQRVATGTASLVIATMPLWIALFDRVGYGQRLSPNALVGLVLGFGGVALLAGPAGADRIDLVGLGVLLAGAAAWAVGSLYSRHAPLPRRPLVASSMQMVAGGALLAVLAAATGEIGDVRRPSAESALAVAYLVLFGSIVAFSTYAWLLRTARTSLVATYAYVNPLVAVFLGWAIEDEGVGLRTVGAGALILVAVALIVSPPGLLRRPGARKAAATLAP
jgi:drug/metabolite transporter (DMT)-like permease